MQFNVRTLQYYQGDYVQFVLTNSLKYTDRFCYFFFNTIYISEAKI